MKIGNRIKKYRLKQKIVLLASLVGTALLAGAHTQAKADVPFVVEAIEKAQTAPTAEGRWAVIANVVFTSEKSGTMTASGEVNFEGFPVNGLKGIIPMTIGDNAETSKINALGLAIKPDGTVGIQWLIAGKPYLGRPTFVFQPSAFPDYLSKRINFGSVARRMKLTLSSEWIKAEKPRIRKKPPVQTEAKTPIGKRYKISARVVITNSDDGVLDDTVEVKGDLELYHWGANGNKFVGNVGNFVTQPLKAGQSVFLGSCFIDYIFDKPDTKYYAMRGSFFDTDDIMLTGLDMMNDSRAEKRNLPIHATFKEEFKLTGDEDDESLDIYYKVIEVEDLY